MIIVDLSLACQVGVSVGCPFMRGCVPCWKRDTGQLLLVPFLFILKTEEDNNQGHISFFQFFSFCFVFVFFSYSPKDSNAFHSGGGILIKCVIQSSAEVSDQT